MTPPNRQPPMINAPWPVAGFAIFLLAAHLVINLLPDRLQNAVFYYGALIPERFWVSPDTPSLDRMLIQATHAPQASEGSH